MASKGDKAAAAAASSVPHFKSDTGIRVGRIAARARGAGVRRVTFLSYET